MPLAQLADPWQKMPLGGASGEVRHRRADRQLSVRQVAQEDTIQEVTRFRNALKIRKKGHKNESRVYEGREQLN